MKEKIENLGKVAVTIEEDYWDIKKPYDKLTIVEREGTGTTFISRKPVPSGTSILNRKYWIKFSKWSDIPYKITQKFGDSEELAISQKTLTNKFSDVETEIKEGDESLDRRLRTVEVHERIMVDGGELEVATGYDLEHPESPRQEAAVPTVRAILDASDDEPHLNSTKRFINSDNLAKMYGYYLDNPEFIYLLLDSEYHIILGVKTNGDVVFGIGVPSQIKEYVETKIKGYGDIVNFLDGIEYGDKKLQELLDEKENKVEGKSLIDAKYAEGVHYIENPEFFEVKLDQDNRILEAIMLNGTKLLPAGYNIGGNVVKTIDNPEYLAAWLDSNNHILFALKADGDVVFGCGVPSQIKDHVSELIEMFHYEDNPEFVNVKLDAKNKILEATEKDGTKVFGGDVKVLGSINISGIKYKVVSNPEWIKAIVDSENKIICGIKADGTFCVADIDFLDSSNKIREVLNHFDIIDNPEFLSVELDENKKVLGGRKVDGTKFENVGLDLGGAVLKSIDDPEGRMEVKTDSTEKIINYRKDDGTLVENVGIETNHLELTEQGMNDFQQALKDAGFTPGGGGNLSDKSEIQIPEPRLAFINITNDTKDAVWPTSKYDDYHYWMEFYDGAGNYFKKRIILNAQGNSSMAFPKKNGAIDICNDEWEGDDTCEIRFGNWPACDSFHLKAYYFDFFRGTGIIAYKFSDMIDRTRPFDTNKPWKKSLLSSNDKDDTKAGNSNYSTVDDTNLQIDNGARCVSDGFPSLMFLNGKFYGIYVVSYKKHRSNYNLNKKNPKHIHLDGGALTRGTIFGGTVNWTQFEVRNPKNLVYAAAHTDLEGKTTFKYDADITNGQDEIAGNDKNYDGDWVAGTYAIGRVVKLGSNYFINQVADNNAEPITKDASGNKNTADSPDFKNKTKCGWINCTNSVKVKQYIIDLSQRMGQIEAAADQRAEFEKYFDIDNLVDYELLQCTLHNVDSQGYNWQLITYDGVKWYFCVWDAERIFGQIDTFNFLQPAITNGYLIIGSGAGTPNDWVNTNCKQELKERWNELVNKKIINADTIINMFKDWTDRIGSTYYKKEFEVWSDSPCNRPAGINENWQFDMQMVRGDRKWNNTTNYSQNTLIIDIIDGRNHVFKAMEANVNKKPTDNPSIWEDMTFDSNNSYSSGDYAYYGINDMARFKCISNTSDAPLDTIYNTYPNILGYNDNVWRVYTYIKKTITAMSNYFDLLQ